MQGEGNLQNHAGIRSSCMVLRQDGSALWQQAPHQRHKGERVPRLGLVDIVVQALPDPKSLCGCPVVDLTHETMHLVAN